MKKSLWIFLPLLALALIVILTSCKTEREQSALGPHPSGWMDPASANFHGIPAQRDSNQCRACHGQDLHGGSTGVSCYQCHATFPHPAGWLDTTSAMFHGLVAKTDSGKMCESCHGADFTGGISEVSCRDCHAPYPHITFANWKDSLRADTTFHGWTAMADLAGPGVSCEPCHGADFHGTARAQSCYDCHTILHPTVSNEDTGSHRAFVASKGWKITTICSVCHRFPADTTWNGGPAAEVHEAANCSECHVASVDTMRLNGCNVCHTDEPALRPYWKVPYGTVSAGAHPLHVEINNFACRECHPSLSAAGHPHQLPADVQFVSGRTRFANLFGFTPTFTPLGAANSGNGACSNVYCHSDGVQPSPHPATTFPQWTLHGACGMCHGIPPTPAQDPNHPQGAALVCSNCHHDVDPTSNFNIPDSIRFIADSLHVDGVINF